MVRNAPYSLGKFGFAIVSAASRRSVQKKLKRSEYHHRRLDQFLHHSLLYA